MCFGLLLLLLLKGDPLTLSGHFGRVPDGLVELLAGRKLRWGRGFDPLHEMRKET